MDPFAPREQPRRPGAAVRSRSWLVLALVALLLVAYAIVVATIGSKGAGTAEEGASPGGGPSAEEARADPGEKREKKAADDRNGPGDKQELPLTAPGDEDRGEPNPNAAPEDGHEDFVTEPEGSDAGPGPGGAKGEPSGYDPLGKGTDGPVLSETQLERAELAVSNYVTAVYGYSGDDDAEYQKKVGEAVVFPGFFSSPGAESVREVQRRIERSPDGVTSGATLKGFAVEQQTDEQIEGVAYFEVGERVAFSKTDPSGVSLEGEITRYAQPLDLRLYGPQWRVTAAGQRQEVSE